MDTQKLLKHFSTLLIIIPLLTLLYIYFPLLQTYIFPKEVSSQSQTSDSYWLTIPSINAEAPIVKDVDPWNEDEYQQKLKEGIAHANGTSLPGEAGTSYLFAHSSDYPWNITQYNTAFYKLHQVKKGDEVIVYKGSEEIKYVVKNKVTIKPTDVQYLTQDQGNVLILQTCTPIGTDWNRLLVIAERV